MARKGQLNVPEIHGIKYECFAPNGDYSWDQLKARNWLELWEGANVIISRYGEVAIRLGGSYRVLEQQDIGNYLAVWLRLNPEFLESGAYPLHRLVARKWVPITTTILLFDEEKGISLADRVQIDHLDKNPFNNYAGNLEWVTPAENRKRKREDYIPEKGITIDLDCLPLEDRKLVS